MLASIKSEFRKLLSVRSTYIVTLLGLGLLGFVSFYGNGMQADPAALQIPEYISSQVLTGVQVMAVFIAIIALLQVTHEYRHNTIMYTLTASNSRFKSFLAKALVIATFSIIVTAIAGFAAPMLTKLGIGYEGLQLAPQEFYADIIWRGLFFGFGNAMAAFVIAFLIRNQVGAIATFFIVINTVEGLLSILLKDNTKYLPFTALQGVVSQAVQRGDSPVGDMGLLSPGKGTLVFSAYLAVGGIIALILFLRRDAN